MRPWFLAALLCAAVTLGCSTLNAEPARVQPPRTVPLQTVIANSYANGLVRIMEAVWLKHYAVDAEGGLASIRGRLDQLGPVSEVAGRRFDGLTTWGLRWSFNFEPGGASCRLRNATLEIEAVITLPELTGLAALSDLEADLWQAYLGQLRAHEEGHVNIYRAAAQELSNEILALGGMPDCDQLRRALSNLGEAKIARIQQADLSFDLQTGHGAVFPTKK